MTTAAARYLIVNADDFGQSRGVNMGVAIAHERGVVTSASMMVRWDAAREAAEYARAHPDLSVGLHVDIGEWAFREGRWEMLREVVPRENADLVALDVASQLALFRELMGCDPTHLDSHQHVHHFEPMCSILQAHARELDVPLRNFSDEVAHSNRFYGQLWTGEPLPEAIAPERLVDILWSLPPGVTELGCHPGRGPEIESMYREERAVEVDSLCHASVRDALRDAHVELCSFETRPRLARARQGAGRS